MFTPDEKTELFRAILDMEDEVVLDLAAGAEEIARQMHFQEKVCPDYVDDPNFARDVESAKLAAAIAIRRASVIGQPAEVQAAQMRALCLELDIRHFDELPDAANDEGTDLSNYGIQL